MSEPSHYKVVTGGEPGGGHRVVHLLVGALGWLLWAGLIVLLASQASEDALDVAAFLATMIVLLTLFIVITGAAFRAPLMRDRARAPIPVEAQLERPLPTAEAPTELTGEIGLEPRGS